MAHGLHRSLEFLYELGWESGAGIEDADGFKRHASQTLQATARRCYRILWNIEKAIKSPVGMKDAVAKVPAPPRDLEPFDASAMRKPQDQDKDQDYERQTSTSSDSSTKAAPSRFSRNPDQTLAPMRLQNMPPTNPYSDDHFISSWIHRELVDAQ